MINERLKINFEFWWLHMQMQVLWSEWCYFSRWDIKLRIVALLQQMLCVYVSLCIIFENCDMKI